MDSAGNSSSMQSSSGGGGDADEYDDPRADHAVSFSSAAAASYLNLPANITANLLMTGSGFSHSGLLHHQQQQLPAQQLPSSFLDYSFLPQRHAAAEEPFPFASAAPRPSSSTQAQPGSSSGGAVGSHLLNAAGAGDHVDWAAMASQFLGLMGLTSQREVMQHPASTLVAADLGPVNYPANQPEATSSVSAAAVNPQAVPSTSQQPPPPQQLQPTSQAVAGGAAPAGGGPQAPARASRKRPRASRRAPTTVLTTDTSNFRQMVQKFTGIPLQPFGPSGSLMFPTRPPLTRMDMLAGNGSGTGPSSSTQFQAEPSASSFLLRPFPQRAGAASFPYGGGVPPSIAPPTTSGATGSNSGSSSAMTVLPSSSPNRMMMVPSTSDHNTSTGSPSPAASYGLLAPRDHVGGVTSSGVGQRAVGPPQNPGFTFRPLVQKPPELRQPYRYYSPPLAPASQQTHRTASLMRDSEYGASQSDIVPTEWAAQLQVSSSNTNMDGSAGGSNANRQATDVPEGTPENPPTSPAPAAATTRGADDLFS